MLCDFRTTQRGQESPTIHLGVRPTRGNITDASQLAIEPKITRKRPPGHAHHSRLSWVEQRWAAQRGQTLHHNIFCQPHLEKGKCRTNGFYLVGERAGPQASRVEVVLHLGSLDQLVSRPCFPLGATLRSQEIWESAHGPDLKVVSSLQP